MNLTLEKVEQGERLVPNFTWAQLQEIKTKIAAQMSAGASDNSVAWRNAFIEKHHLSNIDVRASKHFMFGQFELELAVDTLSEMFEEISINLREIQYGHTYPKINDGKGIPVYNTRSDDPYWPLGKRTEPPEWVCVRLSPGLTHIEQSLMFEKPNVITKHYVAALPEFPQTVLELMRRANAVIGSAVNDYDCSTNYYLFYTPEWKLREQGMAFPTQDPILLLNISVNARRWDKESMDFRYIDTRQLLIGRWGDDSELPE